MNYINFDRVAMVYDKTRAVPMELITILIELINKILHEIYDCPPYRILSVGIGSGRVESFLSSQDNHLFGIDISELMLKVLKKKSNYKDISILRADACNLPFRGKFHLTIAIHLYHLIQNRRDFVNELVRTSDTVIVGDVYTDSYQSKLYTIFLEILANLGWKKENSIDTNNFLQSEMSKFGFTSEEYSETILSYQTHAVIYESIANRYFSWLWDVPETIYKQALDLLRCRIIEESINLEDQYETIAAVKLLVFK